ncbi:MAG: response regulator [Anaerolineae bacterium]|nr:response regulator [Anaerolineae bacterium]
MTQLHSEQIQIFTDMEPEPSGLPLGNILVIDDTSSSRQLLLTILTDQEYDVRAAADGPTALMMAQAEPPDLILLDIQMPGMDGYELCRQLKCTATTCDIPIIFISALDTVIDKVKGFELGAVDYIAKPFQAEEVMARVNSQLKLYQLKKELEQRNRQLQHQIQERRQAENLLQQRVVELSALHSVAHTMAAMTNLPEALNHAAKIITHLFDSELTFISVPLEENAELRTLAGYRRSIDSFTDVAPAAFRLEDTPATRQALESGQSQILTDLQTHALAPMVRMFIEKVDLQAVMIVPLRMQGVVTGTFLVGSTQAGRTFNRHDIILAETIAGDIAAAVTTAQLAEQARAAAVDAERQRLARELHDSVTQSLYSLTLLTSGWGTMATQGQLSQQQVVDSLRQLGEIGQQGLKEMRLLIHQLRPPVLAEAGLVGAVQQRLDAVEQRVNVETRLYTKGVVDTLPPAVEEQLFHMTLEALNNTLRHAKAETVTVNILADNDCLTLSVQDDGVGFDTDEPSMGLGLASLRERAEAIDGALSITSAPGQGTTVEITVTLEADEKTR